MMRKTLHVIVKWLLCVAMVATSGVIAQTKCDPSSSASCIDRSKYRIRAIVHGRQNDPFWRDMQQSMLETAQDIGVDFQMTLYDESILDSAEISRAMATDIRNIVVLDNPHALIVSVVGDSLVGRALQSIQDRVPIFVVNALTPTTKHTDALPEFQAAIYMDEEDAAAMVADQIQQNLGNVEIHNKPLGVFINHEPGLPLMTRRYNLLTEATNDAVEWESFELLYSTAETSGNLTSLFDGCNYTVVQLAGERAAEATINALLDNGCDQDSVVIGTYDTSPFVYDAIDAGSLNFAISQQPRIQGSMSVLLASVYATTGQMLVAPSLPILLRPKLTTADNIPYNSNKSKEINIKVLTHDVITDPFWESVYSGLLQAASDFGVNLVTHRFKSAVTGRREVSLEHSFFVQEACQTADIDGLIVSLPHDGMVDALSVCYTRRIPVLAINAAPDESITNELPYVGQQDYYSGFEAGKLLINNGALSGYCVLHANLSSLKERCRGMEDAFADSQETEYQGIIYVSVHATESEYKNIMEMTLGKGNWTGIGVLSTGQIQVPALLSLLQEHPELKAGTFDLGSSVDVPIEKLLFSIDQQPYIQGYLSLAMMKWRAADPVVLKNTRFDTGPKVVFVSPSNQKKHCQENGYSICKSKPQLKFSGKCAKLGRLCEVCEGDCDDDSNCAEGLVCFVRDSKTLGAYQDVPGCSTNPVGFNAKDFCVDSALYTCKDEEPFQLRSSDGQGFETCNFVAKDLSRCVVYGIYCRETCGYCRPQPQQ